MSCPVYCPSCDAFQGDVGLCATGEQRCTECQNDFEVGHQTMGDV